MFIYDWFKFVLNFFGLWSEPRKLLILGLENAGKTTLLDRLTKDYFESEYVPSLHPTCESFALDGLTITAYIPGGIRQASKIWINLALEEMDGIVFVMDASNTDKFAESKADLDSLLSDEKLPNIPVLILGNKTDMEEAVSEEEVKRQLNLFGILTGSDTESQVALPGRPMQLFMCSVLKRHGYVDGLRWLSTHLK